MGFKQSAHEVAVYRQGNRCNVLLVDVYVDDLIITDVEEQKVDVLKVQMKKAFDMSDLGLLYFYLNIKVRQDTTGIALHQTHYAKRILELSGMIGCNLTHTPMEEKLKLSWESMVEEVDPTHYRRLIGSLRYLIHTQPDIAFVVRYMSRFIERLTIEHLQAVKRILSYVAGTLNYGLHCGRAPNTAQFVGYCDSDPADDVDTSKSTTETMYFLGDCLVSW
ncbi:uncharacterized mitochondrial protein AtMg00810-like [Miscanthus floridulus]|uniref:uncharacterized mitochondrial protein AtMg00810-like n=1 Tax=Miscanthus floridulus TaxID=154761 RepID=UPI00345ADE2C